MLGLWQRVSRERCRRVGEVEGSALQTPEPPEGVGSGPLLSRGDRTSDGPCVQLFFLS